MHNPEKKDNLGPFALTEALTPSLPNSANVAFVVSAVEDPERKPAVAAGFRGGRHISTEASARGQGEPGGARKPGFDAGVVTLLPADAVDNVGEARPIASGLGPMSR